MKMATSQVAQNIQAAQPTIKLLESIDPEALLLRVRCGKCRCTFTHDVDFVLRMTRSTGFFIPSPLCPTCRAKKRKASNGANKKQKPSKKKAKKVKSIQNSATPENHTTNRKKKPKSKKENEEPTGLTHRPFAVLKDLKSEKPEVLLEQGL
jgi:hypothetical protein